MVHKRFLGGNGFTGFRIGLGVVAFMIGIVQSIGAQDVGPIYRNKINVRASAAFSRIWFDPSLPRDLKNFTVDYAPRFQSAVQVASKFNSKMIRGLPQRAASSTVRFHK